MTTTIPTTIAGLLSRHLPSLSSITRPQAKKSPEKDQIQNDIRYANDAMRFHGEKAMAWDAIQKILDNCSDNSAAANEPTFANQCLDAICAVIKMNPNAFDCGDISNIDLKKQCLDGNNNFNPLFNTGNYIETPHDVCGLNIDKISVNNGSPVGDLIKALQIYAQGGGGAAAKLKTDCNNIYKSCADAAVADAQKNQFLDGIVENLNARAKYLEDLSLSSDDDFKEKSQGFALELAQTRAFIELLSTIQMAMMKPFSV